MAHAVKDSETRRYRRAKVTFSGRHLDRTKNHVLVMNLNMGGAFIKFSEEPPQASTFVVRINLHDGPVTLHAETVYRDHAGHGVRFADLDFETATRLASAAAM